MTASRGLATLALAEGVDEVTSGLSRQCHLSPRPPEEGTRMGGIPGRSSLLSDPRRERSGAWSFRLPVGLGLPDITLGPQVALEIPRQEGLICMISFGRRWGEVGRTARKLDEGKPLTPSPPASK
uniref:Uncharacterized protein n=1 Tax=Molossus molossus TaxID=27622 RepID=A0A7J8ER32_MOLMO|nr:hypothetical protein HJG59_008647 [Molossus molossus]